MTTTGHRVDARDLSCQGLTYCVEHEDGTVTHHGQPVDHYAAEIARRGDWHVHGCELIGHCGDEPIPAATR